MALARIESQEPDDPERSEALDALARVIGHLPHGKRRPGQDRMCDAAHLSMLEGQHLVVAAGTGTGKSLAYLIPALLQAERHDPFEDRSRPLPVVVATATKALQDQLLHHDIPKIAEGLGRPVQAVTLKGRSNYLCRQKLKEMDDDAQMDMLEGPAFRGNSDIGRILEWAGTTATGDQAELTFQPSAMAWRAVSVESRECPGRKKCPSGAACFAEQAHLAAAQADIVIVNMHLYCLDAVLRAKGVPILPPHEIVVFDEAHELEEVASTVFGASISLRRFQSIVFGARSHVAEPLTDDLTKAADALFLLLGDKYRDKTIDWPLPADLEAAVTAAKQALTRVRSELNDTISSLELVAEAEDGDGNGSGSNAQTKMRTSRLAGALLEDLTGVSRPSDDLACWVESNRSSVTWNAATVNVADPLRELIWEDRTAVLCSATIPTNFAAAWGLEGDEHDFIDVGSPFDFKGNSILYAPKSMPPPKSNRYEAALHDEIEALIQVAGGRTLALFTSYKAMDAAAHEMRKRLPYRILTQRDLPKPELLRQFADEPECCLFGTLGLWQGVDIPGESLSQVIIARLPFPRPDDPLMQARRKLHGDRAFMAVDVPRATTRLAQGAGRLIRTETDRGVVAVLDSRLVNSRYGRGIVNSLPPFRRTMERENVERFFAESDTAPV